MHATTPPCGREEHTFYPGKILDLHSHQYFIEWVVFLSRYQVTMQTSLLEKNRNSSLDFTPVNQDGDFGDVANCNEITTGFLLAAVCMLLDALESWVTSKFTLEIL